MKHVVIETKPDPVTGILYHITPNGPFCSSLCELVEEAKKTSIIQNHLFDVVLTKSPPKVSIQKYCVKNNLVFSEMCITEVR